MRPDGTTGYLHESVSQRVSSVLLKGHETMASAVEGKPRDLGAPSMKGQPKDTAKGQPFHYQPKSHDSVGERDSAESRRADRRSVGGPNPGNPSRPSPPGGTPVPSDSQMSSAIGGNDAAGIKASSLGGTEDGRHASQSGVCSVTGCILRAPTKRHDARCDRG